TAVANAWLARVPVLLIGGCTSRPQANMGPLQDIPHVDLLSPVTRTARTLRVPDQVVRELDEAVARAAGDAVNPGRSMWKFQATCCEPTWRLHWCLTTGCDRSRAGSWFPILLQSQRPSTSSGPLVVRL